jgi:hypothetical protein
VIHLYHDNQLCYFKSDVYVVYHQDSFPSRELFTRSVIAHVIWANKSADSLTNTKTRHTARVNCLQLHVFFLFYIKTLMKHQISQNPLRPINTFLQWCKYAEEWVH